MVAAATNMLSSPLATVVAVEYIVWHLGRTAAFAGNSWVSSAAVLALLVACCAGRLSSLCCCIVGALGELRKAALQRLLLWLVVADGVRWSEIRPQRRNCWVHGCSMGWAILMCVVCCAGC